MSGKCRPSLRAKTLLNVRMSSLSNTDKACIYGVFQLAEQQRAEIEALKEKLSILQEHYCREEKFL